MEEFRELYRREKRWLIILPEVTRNMPHLEVERAVEHHLEQTAARVKRLEGIFKLMRLADRNGSWVVKPLLKEADAVLTAVAISSREARGRPSIRPLVWPSRRGPSFSPGGQN